MALAAVPSADAVRAADGGGDSEATADALGAAGKWPIFSSKNLLAAAWEGLPAAAPRPCVIPHDAFFEALAGADYARFYEFFMGGSAAENAPDQGDPGDRLH